MYGRQCEDCGGEDCVCCSVYLEAMADARTQYDGGNDEMFADEYNPYFDKNYHELDEDDFDFEPDDEMNALYSEPSHCDICPREDYECFTCNKK